MPHTSGDANTDRLSCFKYSAQSRLSYLTHTVDPKLFKSAAERFDKMVLDCCLKMFEIKTDTLKQLEPKLSMENVVTQISLPIRRGAGVKNPHEYSHAALRFISIDYARINQKYPSERNYSLSGSPYS